VKNRLRAFPKHENASLTLIQGKYKFFRLFYTSTMVGKNVPSQLSLGGAVTKQRLIYLKVRGFESRLGGKFFAQSKN
jgi:hypothetical protein